MGVARVKGQHRPFQEAFNVMKLTHLCLCILSDGPKDDKTLTSEIDFKKKFFLKLQ